MKAHVTPFSHQWRATAVALAARETDFHGLILADPPGLGKTLSALMALAKTSQVGRGPSCVIVPSSCCRQWMAEIENNFADMPAILLTTAHHVSPVEAFSKYKVIVASYHYVAAEFRRFRRFNKRRGEYLRGESATMPKRPSVTLLSGLLRQEGAKPLGEYLILDEAHHIKNFQSLTYWAIKKLRLSFNTCVMMTGTPLDNTWLDVWALLSMLSGHPVTSIKRMRQAFTERGAKKKKRVPMGCYLTRIVAMLEAATLRRPESLVHDLLPGRTVAVVESDLTDEERNRSNLSYETYKQLQGKQSEESWVHLTRAQQYAYHSMLADVIELEKAALQKDLWDQEESDLTADERKMLGTWRAKLKKNQQWRSGRIDAIINLLEKIQEKHPDAAVLIMDESVYFLDIVQIALEETHQSTPCFRLDGRSDPIERYNMLRNFSEATGFRIMLASRATGGIGLNVQCANVLIRCGPWWKVAWEEQAEGRICRPGQKKPVWIYELKARGKCLLEAAKRKVRDRKNRTNQKITKAITKLDNVEEEPRKYRF